MAYTAEAITLEGISAGSEEATWGTKALPPPLERAETQVSSGPRLYDVGACSDIGSERDNNEDSIGLSYEGDSVLAVVADGVGGCEGGELASKMAVETLVACYREQPTEIAADKRLYRAAQQANIEIYDRAIVVPELCNMSTTLTAIAIEANMLHAAHVGDSRLYLVREGKISQLSKDHTLAAEQVENKRLSPEKARHHPDHGTLTRSVGRELIVAIDRIALPVQTGDALVLCTDGLHNILDESEIVELVREGTAESAAKRLIDRANEKGTNDNLTAAVCRVVGELPAQAVAQSWPKRLRHWLWSRA